MDPLTPRKIERLINLAQGCSGPLSSSARRTLLAKLEEKKMDRMTFYASNSEDTKAIGDIGMESSSGILDLEQCEGFGDSCAGMLSMSKSSAFNPSELTGRSTGTQDLSCEPVSDKQQSTGDYRCSNYLRTSVGMEELEQRMNRQSLAINEMMKNSITSGYSFHSHRDLTADEVSLVAREAPLPVMPKDINLNLTRNMDLREQSQISTMSVGTYFQNRCSDFTAILPGTDSPNRDVSMGSNLLGDMSIKSQDDVSLLDCIPVRQPRPIKTPVYPAPHSPAPPLVMKTPLPAPRHRALNTKTMTKFANPFLADPSKQHLAMQTVAEESTQDDNSFSLSAIANYLVNESDVRPSGAMSRLKSNKKQTQNKKEPLTEISTNIPTNQDFVVNLKDSKRTDTAGSITSVNDSISKENIPNIKIPEVIISSHLSAKADYDRISKSPTSKSTKSYTTCSTVQENLVSTSYRAGDSPLSTNVSQGDRNVVQIPSPNVQYKELDKSVDWQELLHQKRSLREGLAKVSISDEWATISVEPVTGYVGVSTEGKITVTTETDSWLMAKVEFTSQINEKDLLVNLPRSPVLLTPKKNEHITIGLTPNVALKTSLKFTLKLKDASIDMEIEQIACVEVDFKLPALQAITMDGLNNAVNFPPAQEKTTLRKVLVLISDCPKDLLLDIYVDEGNSMFAISNVNEIKRSDLNIGLSENYPSSDDAKGKHKPLRATGKQSCRLTAGNAIRAVLTFTAPRLSELQLKEKQATLNGCLKVNIIGTNTVLRKIDLVATVGCVNLVVNVPTPNLHITNEPLSIKLCNTGTVAGTWSVQLPEYPAVFSTASTLVELHPNTTHWLQLQYLGPHDEYVESTLTFKETTSGATTTMRVSHPTQTEQGQTTFPIKTTLSEISWVREGRKVLSLKNYSDKKVSVKCKVVGGGFVIETSKANCTDLLLSFAPSERRDIYVIFEPSNMMPHKARLMIMTENGMETGKSIRLHGCASGELPRWTGQLTYGDTALVRALARQPIELTLYNRSRMPVFISATLHFNLQYRCLQSSSCLSGDRAVVPGRSAARIILRVDWSKLERAAREVAATTLASVTVLTGAEYTRRRILKVLKEDEREMCGSTTVSEHLQRLTGSFAGEEPALDAHLEGFQETKKSLEVLMAGLQELTAQIDLPQEVSDQTIFLADDTVLEHHTLCD